MQAYIQIKNFVAILFCLISICIASFPSTTHALTISPVKSELYAAAGDTLTLAFDAQNDNRESKTYYLDYQAFNAKDESGNPVLSRETEGISKWFTGPDSITLGPNERKKVSITLSIPTTAEAGGHFGAILLRNDPPQVEEETDFVSIGSQVGMLVLLRVAGDFTEGADILEFSTASGKRFFTSLPIEFYYRFQNNGEDWAKPLGDIVIENIWGGTTKIIPANPTGGNTLPRSIRKYTAAWLTKEGELENPQTPPPPTEPEQFIQKLKHQATYAPIGRYKARLTLTYGSQNQIRTQAETTFWIIPWELLSVAIPSGILSLFVLRLLLKQYNKFIIAKEKKRRGEN